MRAIDLALLSDALSARIASVEARLEHTRDRIRQTAIHREARRALPPATVDLLVEEGVLAPTDVREERRDVAELAATLGALHALQRWTEEQLFLAQQDAGLGPDAADVVPSGRPRAA